MKKLITIKELIKKIQAAEKQGMDCGLLVESLRALERSSKRLSKIRKQAGLD